MQYNRQAGSIPNNNNNGAGFNGYAPPSGSSAFNQSNTSATSSYAPPGPPMPTGSQAFYPPSSNSYGSIPPPTSTTSSYGNTPVVTGPPISAQVSGQSAYVGSPPLHGSSTSGSSSSTIIPPNAGYHPPVSANVAPITAPKTTVQFFSLAGGTPIPSSSASTIPGPPPSFGGSSSMTSSSSITSNVGGFVGSGPPTTGPPVSNLGMPPPPSGPFGSPSGVGGVGPPSMLPPGMAPPPSDLTGYSSNAPGSTGAFEGGQGGAYAHQPSLDNLMPSSLPLLSEVDLNLKCSKDFIRPTVSKIVSSQNLANSSRLPIGVIISPMAGDYGTTNDQIPVVDFGSTGIVRCKRCRAYINPFVVWLETGRKWKCNICGLSNETPSSYFSHLDAQNRRRDRDQRPELSSCSVEFVAPNDYQIRPPQPPTYLFLIDVSHAAIVSGMLGCAVTAVKAVLGELPGHPRTQIGVITFDSTIHFYSLKSTLSAPQMLVVSDLTDIILPLPEDLVANLQESKKVIESLLDSLPSMFTSNLNQPNGVPQMSASCTGSVLAVAKHILEPTGGKLLLFQATLPSHGEGSLKQRDNPRLLGSDKEHTLLNSEDQFYRNIALDYNKFQIAAEVFLFSSGYTDVATLSVLARYTGGTVYYYPAFNSSRDGVSFQKDLEHTLVRATAFEAVIRVRATRGLRVTNFYGNYFIRGTDLLAIPNCNSDSVFGIDLAFDEPVLQAQLITIQTALLYTSSAGERRIRVHNLLIPVTAVLSEMMESCDIDAMMNLLSKQAIEVASKAGLDNARNRVHQVAIDILKSLRTPQSAAIGHGYGPGQPPGQQQPAELMVPVALQLLPLYAMALQKSVILRGGTDIRSDERAYYHQRITNTNVDATRVFIYPRLFSIHDITSDVGLPIDNSEEVEGIMTAGPFRIRLPNLLNLSAERLTSDGIFLLENSVELVMWIGRSVNPVTLATLFNVSSLEGVDMSTISLQPDNSDFSSRVSAVIVALQQEKKRHMQLYFIREGDGYAEAYFSRFLVEDRANFQGGALSYMEYYGLVLRSV